ncbi:FAD:protein FMN transferase [Sessilibacter sp. MAH2]
MPKFSDLTKSVHSVSAQTVLLLVAMLFCSHGHAKWFQENWAIMGTSVGARFWLDDPDARLQDTNPEQFKTQVNEQKYRAEHILGLIKAEMERFDQTYSPYIESSELSQVNLHAYKTAQIVSPEFASLINKSLWMNQISDGAFDVTFASVGRFYDYREKIAPNDDKITQNLPAIGRDRLRWNPQTRSIKFTHPAVKIDFGGLAKGYAVDRGAKILAENGVRHGSVNAGGDTRLLGDNRGRPWLIGIKNPRLDDKKLSWEEQQVLKLPLQNEAISTSGDYERFFIDEHSGERVHHILNPKTGKSSHGLISVSVIGPEGFNTDPLSTAVFVLGAEKGLAMINKLNGYEAILITEFGKVVYSNGLIDPSQ